MPDPFPQLENLEFLAQDGFPLTLEFDASKLGDDTTHERLDQISSYLSSKGYTILNIDENKLEGKPVYHFHVRKERLQNA